MNNIKNETEHPKAFISYSDDGDEHKNWVLEIVTQLRKNGVDADMDIFVVQKETTNLNKMMISGITSENFTIVVLTEDYTKKANNFEGGVGYESELLIPLLKDKNLKDKVIFIKRSKTDFNKVLPIYLKDYYSIDFSDDSKFELKFKELLHRIYGVDLIKKEELGPIPYLTPLTKIPIQIRPTTEYILDSNNKLGNLILQYIDNEKIKFTINIVGKNSLRTGHIQEEAILENPNYAVFKSRNSTFELFFDNLSVRVISSNESYYSGAGVDFNGVYLKNKENIAIGVSNAKDLIKSIGSNRKIALTPGIYNISSTLFEKNNYLDWIKDFDGYEPIFHDINNIEIIGDKKEETKIVIDPRYAFVLSFFNSNKVKLKNLTVGHTVGGSCLGGVINFKDSSDICIDNCILYGCGTVGLELDNVTECKIINSTVKECTYHLLKITNSRDILFENTYFLDTGQYDLINVKNSRNILFKKSAIKNNWTTTQTFKHLFMLGESITNLKLSEVIIENNKIDVFTNIEDIIQLENCKFLNNTFVSPFEDK